MAIPPKLASRLLADYGNGLGTLFVNLLNDLGADGSGAFTTVVATSDLTVGGDVNLTDAIKTSFVATNQIEFQMADNVPHSFAVRIGAAGSRALTIATSDGSESVGIGTGNVGAYVYLNDVVLTTIDLGTVAGTGIVVEERGDGNIHKSVFTLTAHSVTITDAGAAGAHGTTAFYTFPEGHIRIFGAHVNLTAITAGAGGISDTATLDIGVGQAAVATDNGELTGTESDILLIDEKLLAAGAATGDAIMGTTPIDIDGSTTAGTLNLNVAMPDADSSASDTLAVTGTITIYWINMGDD